jgi:DNA-binding IclR family transcriptional regulator
MLREQQFEKMAKNTLTRTEDILDEYEKIRQNGYVISDEETYPYAVGVGIPIPNSNSEIKTCVAISFIKKGKYNKKINELLELLLEYKSEIIKYMV